nr:sodium:calcium symporter [Bacteroidota bacterium]
DNKWAEAFSGNWELDGNSIIGKLAHKGIEANRNYFADHFESEVAGEVVEISPHPTRNKQVVYIAENRDYYREKGTGKINRVTDEMKVAAAEIFDSLTVTKTYNFSPKDKILVSRGDIVQVRTKLAAGSFTNNIFFHDMARGILILLFLFICMMVFKATVQREKIQNTNL